MKPAHGRLLGIGLIVAMGIPESGNAQVRTHTTVATVWESYSFDEGLGFESLSEVSLPVVVGLDIGDRTSFVVSSGYASVTASADGGAADVTVSGVLDTEARLTLDLVPRRVSLVLSGILPTGVTDVAGDGGPVLGLIAAEALDFSVVRLGSGGGVGGGVIAAIPAGRFALGLAATFNQAQEYAPVDEGALYKPGAELRLRIGAEGPVGPTTYVRVAGIVSRRGEDSFGGTPQPDPGAQTSLYAAVERGLGGSNLSIYAFGSRRSAPSIEQSAVGLAVLPESRTLVLGAQWGLSVRRSDTFSPSVEFRVSDAAPLEAPAVGGSVGSGDLERLGQSLRFGVDYRLMASSRAFVVFQASALTGEVRGLETDGPLPGVRGFRAGARLEWRP